MLSQSRSIILRNEQRFSVSVGFAGKIRQAQRLKAMKISFVSQTNRSSLHFSLGTDAVTSIYHDEDALITFQRGGTLKTWSIESAGYEIDKTIDTNHTGFCRFHCVQTENSLFCPLNQNEILVADLKSNKTKHTFSPENHLHDLNARQMSSKLGQIMCLRHVQFSNQSYILAGYESGAFITWDLRANRIIDMTNFFEDNDWNCPFALDFCSMTNRGIVGYAGDKLGVIGYNQNDMKLQKRSDISVKCSGINCIKIRRDQKIFCAGGSDGRVRIFSWKSLRPLAVLTDHKATITDIEYSNEKVDLWKSPIMATSSMDGQISLWNIYN